MPDRGRSKCLKLQANRFMAWPRGLLSFSEEMRRRGQALAAYDRQRSGSEMTESERILGSIAQRKMRFPED